MQSHQEVGHAAGNSCRRAPRRVRKRPLGPSPGQEWSLEVNCNEVLEQLGDYLDEDARLELCRAIEQHLHQCHDCQVYVDTIKKTIVLYQADRSVELPVTASSKLVAALAREYARNPLAPSD